MKNYNRINRNKQQQQNRLKRLNTDIAIYKRQGSYRVISKVDLCADPLEFSLSLPYNFTMYETRGLSNHSFSYLVRASDILLITVCSNEYDQDLITFIKRYMPTAVVVYERKQKPIARNVAKVFGDVPICELSNLNTYLARLESSTTMLCKTRPYMVAQEVSLDGGFVYIGGFMKNGLRSNKIIINGVQEGIVEEVLYGDVVLPGANLNAEENESLITRPSSGESEEEVDLADEDEPESAAEEDDTGSGDDSISEYDLEDAAEYELDPEYDLIKKYGEYRGILNLATCTFKDQKKPEYYNDLIFMKNIKYAQNSMMKKESLIPKNTYVTLKIRTAGEMPQGPVVVFNMFEFETYNTIHNYDFSVPTPLPKEITIDNGWRIYNTRTILTRNLRHNVFKEEPDLTNGIVSFIGPFSFFSSTVCVINDDGSLTKLLNGESKDRIFFDCKTIKGRPLKIFKRYTIIRGMFYNREQVDYFRNIRIEAKHGNQGFIKKAMGTKGLFKAYFCQPIKHDDVITMSLYKRTFL